MRNAESEWDAECGIGNGLSAKKILVVQVSWPRNELAECFEWAARNLSESQSAASVPAMEEYN